jgi:hypothetical protein
VNTDYCISPSSRLGQAIMYDTLDIVSRPKDVPELRHDGKDRLMAAESPALEDDKLPIPYNFDTLIGAILTIEYYVSVVPETNSRDSPKEPRNSFPQ